MLQHVAAIDDRHVERADEKLVHELQTQVKFLEDETALLRRRLTNSPRQVKILEEQLLQARTDVSRAMAQNEEEATGQAPRRRIVISIPDRKLALIEDGKVVKIYPTAVGAAATPSPTGTFTVIRRVPNPTWYHAGKVVPPGKNNPVGSRWIGLSEKGYGIHGTNAPGSIGRNVSHGCIRMRNRDVEQLFELVKVGEDAACAAMPQIKAWITDPAATREEAGKDTVSSLVGSTLPATT